MELIKHGRVYDFMSIRKYWIAFSLILSVLSAILIWKPGPRYGIDFLGGTELTVQFEGAVDTGRICVAALNSKNIDRVVDAIAKVL